MYGVDYHDETTEYVGRSPPCSFRLGRSGLSIGSKSSGPSTTVRSAQELCRPMLNGADACARPDQNKFMGKVANDERRDAVSGLPPFSLTTLYDYSCCLNTLHFTENSRYLSIEGLRCPMSQGEDCLRSTQIVHSNRPESLYLPDFII